MSVTITGEMQFKQFVAATKRFSRDLTAKSFQEKILKRVCQEAVQFLELEYAHIEDTQSKPKVSYLLTSQVTATIVSDGDDVMFIEFGTGTVGQSGQYPKSFLPTSGVPITGAWEYNYPSPAKRYLKGGQIVWRVPDQSLWGTKWIGSTGYTKGTPPHSQFFYLHQYVMTNIGTWVDEIVRTYYV